MFSSRTLRSLRWFALGFVGIQLYGSQLQLAGVKSGRHLSSYLPTSSLMDFINLTDIDLSYPITAFSDAKTGDDERGPAIAVLLPNVQDDFMKFRSAIRTLDENLEDNQATPMLVFQEGNISPETQSWIRNLTRRPVHFPFVDFEEFPPKFNHKKRNGGLNMKGRPNRWGYWQMCRFWITRIWEHPILDNYSTIMRMDTDSCFLNSTKGTPLPRLPSGGDFVYAPHNSNHPAFSTKGLLETTIEYLNRTNHTPLNLDLWNAIPNFKVRGGRRIALPCFYNNFEVTSVDFFRQPHVMAFQRRISEEYPFGVFNQKWGDAPVRYLTVVLYARPDQIAWGLNKQYAHGNLCEHLWDKPKQKPRPLSHQEAIRWLEKDSVTHASSCPEGTNIIDVAKVKVAPRDKRFNCDFKRTLPPINYCGNLHRPSHHPYRWECRLKKRLFERIDEFALKQAPFLFLDLGSAYADWVLAAGMYAPRSQLVPIEANAAPFRNMYKHLMVNPGLVDRVHGLNAAVMSHERFPASNESSDVSLVSDNTWNGPVLCDDGTDKAGVMDTVTTKANTCSTAELRVPIVTIDMIMSAHAEGTLFFMKIDLEGAEFESLQGGNSTFSDPKQRPCIVIIELKVNVDKPYKEAFDFMLDMGYTDYEDIDSGIKGAGSWPPRGTMFANEGNYEFRLPEEELDQCAMRVLRKSQQMMQ